MKEEIHTINHSSSIKRPLFFLEIKLLILEIMNVYLRKITSRQNEIKPCTLL